MKNSVHKWRPKWPLSAMLVATFVVSFSLSQAVLSQFIPPYIHNWQARITIDRIDRKLDDTLKELALLMDVRRTRTGVPCDKEDLQSLRSILLSNPAVRDIGRLSKDNLVCTAVLGKVSRPFPGPHTPIVTRRSLQLFWRIPLLFANGGLGYVLRKDDVTTIVDPSVFKSTLLDGTSYTIDLPDDHSKMVSEKANCSSFNPLCISITLGTSQRQWLEHLAWMFTSTVAIVIAGCITLILLLIHRRYWSFSSLVRRAMRRKELQVVYQPVVCLRTGKTVGAEALLRWPGNSLPVTEIICEAERTGTSIDITYFVLNKVISDIQLLHDVNTKLVVSVNISANELRSEAFIQRLVATLYSTPKQSIALEITERNTLPMKDMALAISRLRLAGALVFIDDFGSGYSSMTALLELDIDGVKLDRTIIQRSDALKFVSAVASICDHRRILVVAEGVEQPIQVPPLLAITDHILAQGWLFGRAMSAYELLIVLNRQSFFQHTRALAHVGHSIISF